MKRCIDFFIKVENNEYIPADLVLLKTSEANGSLIIKNEKD